MLDGAFHLHLFLCIAFSALIQLDLRQAEKEIFKIPIKIQCSLVEPAAPSSLAQQVFLLF